MIIGYTALLSNIEERKCLQAGMCDAISKPATFEDLKLKIITNFCKLFEWNKKIEINIYKKL